MQIKHIARESFAPRRTTQQEGNLAISHGLLGQIVINNQRVLSAITEILTHGAARISGHILHGSGLGSRRCHNNGVFHGASLFKRTHHILDAGRFLSNRHIYAGHVLTFLVDDGVNSNSRFASLPVTNDQFALTTSDGHHGVNRFQTRLHRLTDALTRNHARSHFFNNVRQFGVDWAFTVNWLPQRIDHASNQFRSHRHFQNASRAFDGITLRNMFIAPQDHGTNGIAFQIQRQAKSGLAIRRHGKLQHLALHGIGEAMNANNAISDRDYCALVANFGANAQPFNTAFDKFRNFGWIELHDSFLCSLGYRSACAVRRKGPSSFAASVRALRCQALRRPP